MKTLSKAAPIRMRVGAVVFMLICAISTPAKAQSQRLPEVVALEGTVADLMAAWIRARTEALRLTEELRLAREAARDKPTPQQ